MIDLYTWATPNGRKISILLEELKIRYKVIPINIGNGAQFDENFLVISPNNKIPAIFDHDTHMGLMESGAIMMYLAEKVGKLLPKLHQVLMGVKMFNHVCRPGDYPNSQFSI